MAGVMLGIRWYRIPYLSVLAIQSIKECSTILELPGSEPGCEIVIKRMVLKSPLSTYLKFKKNDAGSYTQESEETKAPSTDFVLAFNISLVQILMHPKVEVDGKTIEDRTADFVKLFVGEVK